MKSASSQKPPLIHVFLTSKEAYLMTQRVSPSSKRLETSHEKKEKNNSKRNNEFKKQMIMAKRQAKTINQLMSEDRNYENELEIAKMNWHYKKRFNSKQSKKMDFSGSMNELISNFKQSEINISNIKKRFGDFQESKAPKENDDEQVKNEEMKEFYIHKSNQNIKYIKGLSQSQSCRNINRSTQKQDSSLQEKVNKTDRFDQPKTSIQSTSTQSNILPRVKNNQDKLSESAFNKFNQILEETSLLCKEIIPDIRKLSKTKKMQDSKVLVCGFRQFKRDRIALVEVLRNTQYQYQKFERSSSAQSKEKEQLHPYIKFLGYDHQEQVPNLQKWTRTEQVESRYLYQQQLEIEKKSNEQIKREYSQKDQANLSNSQSPLPHSKKKKKILQRNLKVRALAINILRNNSQEILLMRKFLLVERYIKILKSLLLPKY